MGRWRSVASRFSSGRLDAGTLAGGREETASCLPASFFDRDLSETASSSGRRARPRSDAGRSRGSCSSRRAARTTSSGSPSSWNAARSTSRTARTRKRSSSRTSCSSIPRTRTRTRRCRSPSFEWRSRVRPTGRCRRRSAWTEQRRRPLRYGTISAAIGDFDLSNEQAEAVLALDPDNAHGPTSAGSAREPRDIEGRKRLPGVGRGEPDASASVPARELPRAEWEGQGGRGRLSGAARGGDELSRRGHAPRLVLRDPDRAEEADVLLDELIRIAQRHLPGASSIPRCGRGEHVPRLQRAARGGDRRRL